MRHSRQSFFGRERLMRIYAQKQRPSQQRFSPQPSRLIQRMMVKQAMPGATCAHAEDCQEGRQPGASALAAARFAHDFSLIPAHSGVTVNLQPKLAVNNPGDIYEQEADRVADQVMRLPEAQLQASPIRENVGSGNAAPPIVSEVLDSSGQPLDAQTRDFMESRFGHDFSHVRVHTDGLAVKSAQAIHARAYTAGRNIAFGEGQYSPQTLEGKRLLAHELTHVIHQIGGSERFPALQRKEEGQAKPAGSAPFAVTFKGCDKSPYTMKFVEPSAKNAFETTRDDPCIKNESLRKDMLAAYNGLTIICEPDGPEDACAETIKSSKTIRLYRGLFKGNICPNLEPLIFHETVHVAERWNIFSEGTLAYDCGESCYGGTDLKKRGNPAHCDYERGRVQFGGVSTGVAFPEKGDPTGYLRLYVGAEKRGPILGFVRPAFGLGLSLIGESETGEPGNISSGTSALISLMSALRFDPGKEGSYYFSFSGGPEIALREKGPALGYQVGAKLGYRWHIYDISLDAGIEYDPTRRGGLEKMYTLGASLQIAPKVRP